MRVVGNVEQLGGWEVANGVPMEWSEGHVWRAEVDLPGGAEVAWKFVRVVPGQPPSWEPSIPNRLVLTTTSVPSGSVAQHLDCHWNNLEFNPRLEAQVPLAKAAPSATTSIAQKVLGSFNPISAGYMALTTPKPSSPKPSSPKASIPKPSKPFTETGVTAEVDEEVAAADAKAAADKKASRDAANSAAMAAMAKSIKVAGKAAGKVAAKAVAEAPKSNMGMVGLGLGVLGAGAALSGLAVDATMVADVAMLGGLAAAAATAANSSRSTRITRDIEASSADGAVNASADGSAQKAYDEPAIIFAAGLLSAFDRATDLVAALSSDSEDEEENEKKEETEEKMAKME